LLSIKHLAELVKDEYDQCTHFIFCKRGYGSFQIHIIMNASQIYAAKASFATLFLQKGRGRGKKKEI
jgi:hypothetical protein